MIEKLIYYDLDKNIVFNYKTPTFVIWSNGHNYKGI